MKEVDFFKRYKYDRTKDRIGGGGFGNVYKVFDSIENETVALKIAEVKPGQENLSLKKEVELASTLERHVNIARYTACYRFDMPNGLFDFGLLQYYPLGNLSQLVKRKQLPIIEKESIAKAIIAGIHHLHSNHIVHRDLKSANILIAQGYQGEYVPKIADFGLSKQFTEKENSWFSNSFAGGSLHYVAPEQLEGKPLRKNVDLWSLGVILYELFVGDIPFKASNDDGSESARAEIVSNIQTINIPTAINNVPKAWQDIIRRCLVLDPNHRAKSIEELMSQEEEKVKDTIIDPPSPHPPSPLPPQSSSTSKWIYYLLGGMVLVLAVGLYFTNKETPEWKLQKRIISEISSNMVRVEGGTFMMGCTDEQGQDCASDEYPAHEEEVRTFSISKYEVTQAQYQALMWYNPSDHVNCDRCPIENVSWYDALEFIKKLNELSGEKYRLPTAVEWEYAARGGKKSNSYKYSGSNDINKVAWYYDNSGGKTHEVGGKDSNELDLHDMSGNVWECCSDKYSENYNSPRNLKIRGGSWIHSHQSCRVASNYYYYFLDRSFNIGFRLCRT